VIAGRRYLLRGQVVTVLIAWKSPPRAGTPAPVHRGLVLDLAPTPCPDTGPTAQCPDLRPGRAPAGASPFRGLRRPPEPQPTARQLTLPGLEPV
jgi:hypothetical protein